MANLLEESELQQLLQDRSFKAEAKSWLTHTFAQLINVSPAARWACFHPCNTESAQPSNPLLPPRTSPHQAAAHDGYYQSAGPHDQPQPQRSPVASCSAAELQLLQMLTESAPADVSTLLLRDPDWLCSFLTASSDHIKAWFGHFGPTGIQHFKYGAKALANYALAERVGAWAHLVWKGKHSQSPVAVASKPHYFGELDVVATIHNLSRSCPAFWRSDELMRSCQAGEWLGLDRESVAKELARLLHDRRSSRHKPLMQLLSDYLASADWMVLCQRLLPLLPDNGLLQVAQVLAAGCHSHMQQHQQDQQQGAQRQRHQRAPASSDLLGSWCAEQAAWVSQHAVSMAPPSAPLQAAEVAALQSAAVPAGDVLCTRDPHIVLLGCFQSGSNGTASWSLDQLLLANALTCYRSQLLSLLWQDEEAASQLLKLVRAASALCTASIDSTSTAQANAQGPGQGNPAAGSSAAAAAAAGGGGGSQLTLSQLPVGLTHLPAARQLLLVLVAAWLLRLHLLLQLSEAATALQDADAAQQADPVAVVLPSGGVCCLLTSTGPAASPTGVGREADLQQEEPSQVLQQQQHQKTDAQQQQQEEEEVPQPPPQHKHDQQQPPLGPGEQGSLPEGVKQPLRRGTPAKPSQAAVDSQSSGRGIKHSSKDRQHKSRKHHKKRGRSKRRTQRRHGDSSGSSSDDRDDSRSRSRSRSRERHKRRKHKKQRRTSRSSSSSDGASSDDEWLGMDLDAAGELLDPDAFSSKPHTATTRQATAPNSKQLQPTRAAAVPANSAKHAAAAAAAAAALEQPAAGDAAVLSVVSDQLSSLSVGGRLWQWPTCLAVVPWGGTKHPGGAAASDQQVVGSGSRVGRCISLRGSITEVSDALAQLWLFDVLQQLLPRL